MGTYYRIEKRAVCPYYTGDYKRRSDGHPLICCEDGTRIPFPDRCSFSGFVEEFCLRDWRSCCVARMRNRFYERTDPADEKGGRQIVTEGNPRSGAAPTESRRNGE